MRSVTLKSTSENVSLQNPNVEPGFTPSNALNVKITDVPDDVTDQQVVRMYTQTCVYHALNSTYVVPYVDLGVGKALVVGK